MPPAQLTDRGYRLPLAIASFGLVLSAWLYVGLNGERTRSESAELDRIAERIQDQIHLSFTTYENALRGEPDIGPPHTIRIGTAGATTWERWAFGNASPAPRV